VGLVYLHAQGAETERALELNLPGDRAAVRGRATVAGLHLLRELLSQFRHKRS
jgi:nicotinamide mononucleotide (NMN) deamidase PncC